MNKNFKLDGEAINFRHIFLLMLSDIFETNKKTLKFEEGTEETQDVYIFHPAEDITEIIKPILKKLELTYYFTYEFKDKNLEVREIIKLILF